MQVASRLREMLYERCIRAAALTELYSTRPRRDTADSSGRHYMYIPKERHFVQNIILLLLSRALKKKKHSLVYFDLII